jgi:hypothetical protein
MGMDLQRDETSEGKSEPLIINPAPETVRFEPNPTKGRQRGETGTTLRPER